MVLLPLEEEAHLRRERREAPEADVVDDRTEIQERDRRERAPRLLEPAGEVRTIEDIDSSSFKRRHAVRESASFELHGQRVRQTFPLKDLRRRHRDECASTKR